MAATTIEVMDRVEGDFVISSNEVLAGKHRLKVAGAGKSEVGHSTPPPPSIPATQCHILARTGGPEPF